MYDNALNDHLGRWNNDVAEINMALYYGNPDESAKKDVELTNLNDVEDMLSFINNL